MHYIDFGLSLAGNFFSDSNWKLYLEFKQCDGAAEVMICHAGAIIRNTWHVTCRFYKSHHSGSTGYIVYTSTAGNHKLLVDHTNIAQLQIQDRFPQVLRGAKWPDRPSEIGEKKSLSKISWLTIQIFCREIERGLIWASTEIKKPTNKQKTQQQNNALKIFSNSLHFMEQLLLRRCWVWWFLVELFCWWTALITLLYSGGWQTSSKAASFCSWADGYSCSQLKLPGKDRVIPSSLQVLSRFYCFTHAVCILLWGVLGAWWFLQDKSSTKLLKGKEQVWQFIHVTPNSEMRKFQSCSW